MRVREVKGRQRYLIVPASASREQPAEWHPSMELPPPPSTTMTADPVPHAASAEPMPHATPEAIAVSSEAVRTWAGFTAKRTTAEKAAADATLGLAGGAVASMAGGPRGPDDAASTSAAYAAAGDWADNEAEAAPAGSDDEDFDSLLARLTGSAATQGRSCVSPDHLKQKHHSSGPSPRSSPDLILALTLNVNLLLPGRWLAFHR